MFHKFRYRWVFGLLAIVGTVSPIVAETPTTYQPDQHIMVKLGNKGERRCVIVSAKPQQDGTIEYQMKAIDNGETITVIDRPGTAVARPLPQVDGNAPKPLSANSDPLLASSLRQPNGPYDKPQNAQLAASPFLQQPRGTTYPPATEDRTIAGMKRTTIIVREPRSKEELQTQATSELPASTIPTGVPLRDPIPVQMARSNVRTPAVNEPVPLGFVIPVSNATTTVKAKQYEREDRIVKLGEQLRNELKPSARELAAEALAEGAGADSAAVRSLLLTAAVNDPAANVRATCVRCLVKIGVKDHAMAALIITGKQDPDARVRVEIDRAEDLMK